MAHVPHVLVAGPWTGPEISLSAATDHHLARVMRTAPDAPVGYTDGAGTVGEGSYRPGVVVRGGERAIPLHHPRVVLAVAPPRSTDRLRFVVEKAAELAVAEIVWLRTRHGEGRAPKTDKAQAWADAALEQSRGAWRTEVAGGGSVTLDELAGSGPPGCVVVAHPGGRALHEFVTDGRCGQVTIAVGPEGGFADAEIPTSAVRVGLGERILRVETAAIVLVGAFRFT